MGRQFISRPHVIRGQIDLYADSGSFEPGDSVESGGHGLIRFA